MKRKHLLIGLICGSTLFFSCKKDQGCIDPAASNYDEDADENDGSCVYSDVAVPETYTFTDDNGNSTVSYQGQIDRLNQLAELTTYMKTSSNTAINAQVMKDMFANTGGNGNGYFSFSSTKQLEDKCFDIDVPTFKAWMDSLADNSTDFNNTASNGQAGTLTTGTSTYLFNEKGYEYVQLIEKGLMGAVFMHQALNVYFGSGKMDVDNTVAEDPDNGKYYTEMEHHFDEAFGYFGVPTNFPDDLGNEWFWGKYCNARDAELGTNNMVMDAFLKGRTAIVNDDMVTRDEAIQEAREAWELVCAATALDYFKGAVATIGQDDAAYLHELSEAYAFTMNLKYAPTETRKMSPTEVDAILADFDNFWNVTLIELNSAISTLENKYNL